MIKALYEKYGQLMIQFEMIQAEIQRIKQQILVQLNQPQKVEASTAKASNKPVSKER